MYCLGERIVLTPVIRVDPSSLNLYLRLPEALNLGMRYI